MKIFWKYNKLYHIRELLCHLCWKSIKCMQEKNWRGYFQFVIYINTFIFDASTCMYKKVYISSFFYFTCIHCVLLCHDWTPGGTVAAGLQLMGILIKQQTINKNPIKNKKKGSFSFYIKRQNIRNCFILCCFLFWFWYFSAKQVISAIKITFKSQWVFVYILTVHTVVFSTKPHLNRHQRVDRHC